MSKIYVECRANRKSALGKVKQECVQEFHYVFPENSSKLWNPKEFDKEGKETHNIIEAKQNMCTLHTKCTGVFFVLLEENKFHLLAPKK